MKTFLKKYRYFLIPLIIIILTCLVVRSVIINHKEKLATEEADMLGWSKMGCPVYDSVCYSLSTKDGYRCVIRARKSGPIVLKNNEVVIAYPVCERK